MRCRVLVLVALIGAPAWADVEFHAARMARDTAPPGHEECHIRLRVDEDAKVSLKGDLVSVQAQRGQGAADDGSQCSAPMPGRDLQDFKFEVKEGAAEISLAEPPSRRNGFRAVISIRNAHGGRLAFRLSWASAQTNDIRRQFEDSRPGGLTWNNAVHSAARGHGELQFRSDPPLKLSDVSVDIDRANHILVSFRVERRDAVSFSGDLMSWQDGVLKADMGTDERFLRLRGPMYVYLDARQNVYRVTFEGTNGQDRLHLTWDHK